MASVSAVTPTTTSATTSASQQNAANQNQFLTLLIAQLKNQDPTSPMDTEAMSAQLAQFSMVEEAIKTNTLLEQLVANNNSSKSLTAINYLGKQVTYGGDQTYFNGQTNASWNAQSPQSSNNVTVSIYNESGTLVQQQTTSFTAGSNQYSWDGVTSTGKKAAPGNYRVVFDAKDGSGQPITVTTASEGVVTAIRNENENYILQIGNVDILINDVTSVKSV